MKNRILILVAIILIAVLIKFLPCITYSMAKMPEMISKSFGKSDTKVVFFLLGEGICGTCPTGRFVYSLRENKDILFFLPHDLTDAELENFHHTFSIKGQIVKMNKEVSEYLIKMTRCLGLKSKGINIIVQINKKGKVLRYQSK